MHFFGCNALYIYIFPRLHPVVNPGAPLRSGTPLRMWYDGFYAITTNLEGDISEILKINRQRWEIKENFRIMKTEFEAHPVYDKDCPAYFNTAFPQQLLMFFSDFHLPHLCTDENIPGTADPPDKAG